jgi:hypothetical protein
MNTIALELLEFHPLKDAKAWKARYHGCTRVSVAWGEVSMRGKVELVHAGPKTVLWLPWYKQGSWRSGKPRKGKLGSKLAIIRIPAVYYKPNQYLLLDGCHRLTEIGPRFVLLDVYHPPDTKSRRAFTDLLNIYYGDFTAR